MIPYDQQPLIPYIVAVGVCYQQLPDAQLERKRNEMTEEQVAEFALAFNEHCRAAYKLKAGWIVKCFASKTGRAELCVWATHRLNGYLKTGKYYPSSHYTANKETTR
jgi:hypothetical protein